MPTIDIRCPLCGGISSVELTDEQYKAVKNRGSKRIQDVAPDLSPDVRELFISGICSRCWDELFG